MSALVCLVSGVFSAMGRADLRRALLIPTLALGSIAMFWVSGSAQQEADDNRPVPAPRDESPRQVLELPFSGYRIDPRPRLDTFTVAGELNLAFAGPLLDQAGLETCYEVRVNRADYDYDCHPGALRAGADFGRSLAQRASLPPWMPAPRGLLHDREP